MAAGRALRTPEEDDFAMQTYMIAGGAALAAVVGYISIYNRLRRLAVKVEEGGSDIDVALEKRYDLLSGKALRPALGGNRGGQEISQPRV